MAGHPDYLKTNASCAYWVGVLFCLFIAGVSPGVMRDTFSYTVVDTGQVRCYSDSAEIEYPKAGEHFFGQDARYIGNEPAYRDNGDGTITDLNTNLMWQRDPGQKMTFEQALARAPNCRIGGYDDWRLPSIKELYSLILFSGTDPDPMGRNTSSLRPFIDTKYFKFRYGNPDEGERIIDSQFATCTKYVSTTMRGNETMFGVNFADGRIKGYGIRNPRTGRDKTFHVLYVRGNKDYGKNDFEDNKDGTVTDRATGLMWMKVDSGSLNAGGNKDGKLNWAEALDWAEKLKYAGYSDWRLPNVKELQSIVNYKRSPATTNSAAIDPVFEATSFIAEGGKEDYPCYWSGTTHAGVSRASAAAYVAFGRSFGWMQNRRTGQYTLMDVHGAGSQRSDPKSGDPSRFPRGRGPQGDVIRIYNFVRCVRDGVAKPRATGPRIEMLQATRRPRQTAEPIGPNDRIRPGRRTIEMTGSQERPTGVIINDEGAFEGYTLFAPISSTQTYLIDNEGRIVNTWKSDYRPAHSAYMLENGHLLRTGSIGPRGNTTFGAGGSGGHVQQFTWEGELLWDYVYSSEKHNLHHDVEYMPNGNILMIAWEVKNRDELLAAGRNPELIPDSGLWVDHVIEVKPTGKTGGRIVWQWHLWDHVIQDFDSTRANYGDVAKHPELLDLNYTPPRGRINHDWNHTNSIDYNPQLDQIVLSLHTMSEIYVIDHSTKTDEAAGHSGGRSGKGGDILYRWGNPQVYRAGDASDRKLFAQHDATWIEPGLPGAGNIMVFNNGTGRPDGRYSSVDVIAPPIDENGRYNLVPGSAYGPKEAHWIYTDNNKPDFFSQNISGAQRLPNGNTLICSGAVGTIFEVSLDKKIVWKYVHPASRRGPGPAGPGPGMGIPPMDGPRGPDMRTPPIDETGAPAVGMPTADGRRGPAGRLRGPGMRGDIGPASNDRRQAGTNVPARRPGMDRPPAGPGQGTPIFRAYRYPPEYPGFTGKDLTPQKPISKALAEKLEREPLTGSDPVVERRLRPDGMRRRPQAESEQPPQPRRRIQ